MQPLMCSLSHVMHSLLIEPHNKLTFVDDVMFKLCNSSIPMCPGYSWQTFQSWKTPGKWEERVKIPWKKLRVSCKIISPLCFAQLCAWIQTLQKVVICMVCTFVIISQHVSDYLRVTHLFLTSLFIQIVIATGCASFKSDVWGKERNNHGGDGEKKTGWNCRKWHISKAWGGCVGARYVCHAEVSKTILE